MNFQLKSELSDSDQVSDEPATNAAKPSRKKVPKELTAQGTTPLGKPRLFVCNTCTRAFARLEHLRRHERSHTNEKPFTCGVCQRKFSRRDLLLRHAQKLHAGCTDAIMRLRKKLIRGDLTTAADAYESGSPNGTQASASNAGAEDNGQPPLRTLLDSIQFNLNLFSNRPVGQGSPSASMRMSRSNSVKDPSLLRQMFDKRKLRLRGASFSAQSGSNYSMALPRYPDSSTADTVEFSTPQLIPTSTSDEDSWLSNLGSIPGMNQKYGSTSQQHSFSLESEIPKHTAMFGGGLSSGLMRSYSVASNTSGMTLDLSSGNNPLTGHKHSISSQPTPLVQTPSNDVKSDYGDYGYSFYDIPESMIAKSGPGPKMLQPLSPIKQELEDDLMEIDNDPHLNDESLMLMPGVNFDFNFLNDIDEIGQDFDVGSKFLPSGYSFYGDNPLVSSSGIESTSPPTLTSPNSISNNGGRYAPRLDLDSQMSLTDIRDAHGYNKTRLFTSRMRHLINKALSKYPISDVMSPSIPSNEKLEYFLQTFMDKFIPQFIHPSKLNESEVMDMTSDEDPQNESARACMPLLVATMGALMANNKNDSEHLYEASRRTIHIYLESRKTNIKEKNGVPAAQPPNPLWLIQSLTLSVIYGLFSDNENNVYIVIRQLNALNSLVKTTLKRNKTILFSVTGEDESCFNAVHGGNYQQLFPGKDPKEIRFRNNINMQSQRRIVLSIYQLTNFILMMFNVPLTLSANNLINVTCPTIYDELIWGFKTYQDFVTASLSQPGLQEVDSYLIHDDDNTTSFKDLLANVSRSDFSPAVVNQLSKLSLYGFNIMVKGLYEFMQYEEFKYMSVGSILDNLLLFIDSYKSNQETQVWCHPSRKYEKVDFVLLVNFVKICSIIDFKLVKEQSWLRNYDELNKNFHLLLTNMENINDSDYLKVIDYCIMTAKLICLETEEVDGQTSESISDQYINDALTQYHSFKTMIEQLLQEDHRMNSEFERTFNLRIHDKTLGVKTPLHSQVLFHIFVIFTIFAVYVAKRNNPASKLAQTHDINSTLRLNQKYISVLRLLAKLENSLKAQFDGTRYDSELTNLFLFLSGQNGDLFDLVDGLNDGQLASTYCSYSLEKALYVLKVGELLMQFLYERNIKVGIFRKLSGSLSQIRKYLIDHESLILP